LLDTEAKNETVAIVRKLGALGFTEFGDFLE